MDSLTSSDLGDIAVVKTIADLTVRGYKVFVPLSGQPTKPGRHKPGEYDHAQGCPNAPPKALQQIADVVLAYRPKSKQPKPRKRKRRRQNVVERSSTR